MVKNPPAMQRPGFNPWVGKIPWRRKKLPTPVFWPAEFHGLCRSWYHKESDTTEQLSHTHTHTHTDTQGKRWASLVAQLVKNLPAMQEIWFPFLGFRKIPWRREREIPTLVFWPGNSMDCPLGHKESDTTESLSLSLSRQEIHHYCCCCYC